MAYFNLAKCRAELRTARRITIYIAIRSSHPCDEAARRVFQRAAKPPGRTRWPAYVFSPDQSGKGERIERLGGRLHRALLAAGWSAGRRKVGWIAAERRDEFCPLGDQLPHG